MVDDPQERETDACDLVDALAGEAAGLEDLVWPDALLRALLNLAVQARSAPNEQAFLRQVAVYVLRLFQADRVEIQLVQEEAGILGVRSQDGSVTFQPLPAEGRISDQVASPVQAKTRSEQSARSLLTLFAPMQYAGDTLGSVQLLGPCAAASFSAEQQRLLALFAQYLALLLRDRRQQAHLGELAVAEERSRLARELHDTVAQSLTVLVHRLDQIEEPHAGVAEARALAYQALEEVRQAIWGLRPALLEALPFHEALVHEVERMADDANLSSRVTLAGQPRSLLPQQEMALFRIAQEALANIVQHAAARRVRVNLSYEADEVHLLIEDDGQGFDPAALELSRLAESAASWLPYLEQPASAAGIGRERHFGLQSMRERARLVGGWVELESAPGKGTRLLVRLPYLPFPEHLDPAIAQRGGSAAPPPQSADLSGKLLPTHQALPPAGPVSVGQKKVAAGRIRILIVDDHAVTRVGVRRLLERYPDFEVVGEAADGLEALAEVQDLGPQVVLMDLRMPGMDGLEALRQLRASNQEVRVLMLSAFEQDEQVLESLKLGASGYVLKGITPDELADAVRAIARGETLLSPGITGKLIEHLGRQRPEEHPSSLLTAREREVLRAMASGLRNKEIARQLYVSERTVTFHLANIYQKLGVTSRTEALRRALDLGLLHP